MKYNIMLLFTIWTWSLMAQDTLRLETVMKAATENNYSVKLAKNQIEMLSNRATIGMAGFLPTADIGASYTYSNSISKTTFSGNIPDQEANDAVAHNYAAKVNVRYTIFDGFKSVYQLKKSKVEVQLGVTKYQQIVGNTMYLAARAFYNVANLQDDYDLAAEKLELTKIQLKRLKIQREYGQGSEVEYLNLQTVYNRDSTQLMRVALGKSRAIQQLNKIIGTEKIEGTAIVSMNRELDLTMTYASIMEIAQANNLLVKSAVENIEKAELDYKILETSLYPKLNTTLSYGYSGAQNDVGILQSTSNLGPSINIGLSYVFYAGGKFKPNKQNAELNIKNAKLNMEAAKYNMEQDIKDAWIAHQNNKAMIPIEESNIEISQKNFERTRTAYQLGQIPYVSYQQAEFNYLQAKRQWNRAKHNAKVSELELLKIACKL